jgi:hypothetical protein
MDPHSVLASCVPRSVKETDLPRHPVEAQPPGSNKEYLTKRLSNKPQFTHTSRPTENTKGRKEGEEEEEGKEEGEEKRRPRKGERNEGQGPSKKLRGQASPRKKKGRKRKKGGGGGEEGKREWRRGPDGGGDGPDRRSRKGGRRKRGGGGWWIFWGGRGTPGHPRPCGAAGSTFFTSTTFTSPGSRDPDPRTALHDGGAVPTAGRDHLRLSARI